MISLYKIFIAGFVFLSIFTKCETKDRVQNDKKSPQISVEGFYPDSGSVGTMVTILGSNFKNQRDIPKVLIGKVEVKPFKSSDQEISFLIPADLKEDVYGIELKDNNTNIKLSKTFKVISDAGNITDQKVLSYNYVIGTQTFDPKYRFTHDDGLIETANAILEMGSNILKISLSADKYGLSHEGNEVSLIQEHPSFKKVLEMPFSYYFFWVASHSNWRDGYTVQERMEDSTLISDLTIYLREEFRGSGKKFFLGHWEGDWYLLPGYNTDHKPTDTSLKGMIEYYNARQNALEEAKRRTADSDVEIYQYAEVNRVIDAMEGKRRLTNYVLPYSNVDYVSYSCYDGQTESRPNFHAILDFIEEHLPEKEGIQGKRVFIGEYAIPAKSFAFSKFEHESANRNILVNSVTWGVPFVLYWEMYNNEVVSNEHMGFWLIDDTGVKWPFYYTHRMALTEGKKWVNDFRNKFQRLPSDEEYQNWLRTFLTQ